MKYLLVSCLLLSGCQTTIFVNDIEKAMKVCETHQGLYKIVKFGHGDGNYRVTCIDDKFFDTKLVPVLESN